MPVASVQDLIGLSHAMRLADVACPDQAPVVSNSPVSCQVCQLGPAIPPTGLGTVVRRGALHLKADKKSQTAAIIEVIENAILKKLLLTFLGLGAITFAAVPVHSNQIISDEKVGVTMAEVKCGERDVNAAVSYLNNMGVPVEKISNMASYPDVMRGFNRHLRWKTC